MVKISATADKTFTYVTKVTGVSTGAAAKETVDMLETVACQDGICAVVSGIEVCADGLSMAPSFIYGPNITTIVIVLVPVCYIIKPLFGGLKVLRRCRGVINDG